MTGYNRKYYLNESIFSKIDTAEKAYLLGFIYADGGVYGNVLTIGQSGCQHEILYKFIKIFETNKGIYKCEHNKNWKPAYQLSINSKSIINDLFKFGVMENKSFKIRCPVKKIKKEFIRHFIRGYFDGDGYLTIRKNRKATAEFAICSNDNFCADIQKVLKQQFNIESRICKNKTHKISELRIGKFHEINKVYKLLYSNTDLYLHNKHNKFLELFERKGYK